VIFGFIAKRFSKPPPTAMSALTLSLLALSACGIHAVPSKQKLWGNVNIGVGNHYKCHQTCRQDGCVTVEDQSDCLTRAMAAGHNFYSYRSYDRLCSTSSSCAMTVADMPWHSYQVMWPEVKQGNFKCHTECNERVCLTAKSQAECQSIAMAMGLKFFSYRDVDRKCAPTISCNNITATTAGVFAWRAYGTEDAIKGAATAVWSMVGGSGFHKCHANCATGSCFTAANQADCRGHAESAGDTYYSYRPQDKMCSTSKTCETPPEPTQSQWMSFAKMWNKVVNMPMKCHSTCAEGGCYPVANRGDCQRKAESFGHKYYSYRVPDKMCITMTTCDTPKATVADWRTFAI
jgi:hypothetical protein